MSWLDEAERERERRAQEVREAAETKLIREQRLAAARRKCHETRAALGDMIPSQPA
jgi:hypothetical protein